MSFYAQVALSFHKAVSALGPARGVERAASQLRDLLTSQAGRVNREAALDRNLARALLAAMPDRVLVAAMHTVRAV